MSIIHYVNSQNSATTVLLPNQMYPENSLMRTHSLGNIKNENQQKIEKSITDLDQVSSVSDNRKSTEKKWLETSLDCASIDSGPILSQTENKHPQPYESLVNHFDTVIIFLQI